MIRESICCFAAAAVLLAFLLLTSCSSWQSTGRTTLVAAEAAVDGASKTGLDYYRRHCLEVATGCPAGSAADKSCPALLECQGRRALLQAVLDRASLAVSAGWAVLVAADSTGWTARAVEVQAALADLAKLLGGVL